MAEFNFIELTRADGYDQNTSVENGAGRCTYQLKGETDDDPPEIADIEKFAVHLCGCVENSVPQLSQSSDEHAGKIRRQLPKLHPFMRGLSVSGISRIIGEGVGEGGEALQGFGIPTVTDQFWHYQRYNFVTDFIRRPYFLRPDDLIRRDAANYDKPDGTSVGIYYAAEWDRYVVKTLTPMPDTVKATTGAQMRFRTSGGTLNGAQYPSQVWQFLELQMLEVTWFMVPYRYFWNHKGQRPYLTRFINTVNQHELFGFEPGQLLWLGATPTQFVPQSPETIDLFGLALFRDDVELCNVKMKWLVTTRESTDLPASEPSGNANNIMAGHNLQPSFTDRKFHYVTTEDQTNPADTTKWNATYPSFPHELFFTDPMLVQPSAI